MNQAIHSTTGQQPFFDVFSRHNTRNIGVTLPEVSATSDELVLTHELLQNTYLNMARKLRAVANRRRRNQSIEIDSLVWVKAETVMPGVSNKLQARWIGITSKKASAMAVRI